MREKKKKKKKRFWKVNQKHLRVQRIHGILNGVLDTCFCLRIKHSNKHMGIPQRKVLFQLLQQQVMVGVVIIAPPTGSARRIAYYLPGLPYYFYFHFFCVTKAKKKKKKTTIYVSLSCLPPSHGPVRAILVIGTARTLINYTRPRIN